MRSLRLLITLCFLALCGPQYLHSQANAVHSQSGANNAHGSQAHDANAQTACAQAGRQNPNAPQAGQSSKSAGDPAVVVRLYNLRHASDIAKAINESDPKCREVESVGSDLLYILPTDHARSEAIRRTIALMDLPTPQVSLRIWEYEFSAKGKDKDKEARTSKMQREARAFLKKVDEVNLALSKALGYGLSAVEAEAAKPGYFDDAFRDYLTEQYADCAPQGKYCLGYTNALNVPKQLDATTPAVNPSLGRFLLLLAAAKDGDDAGQAVARMKAAMVTQLRLAEGKAKAASENPCKTEGSAGTAADHTFDAFFSALRTLTKGENFRAAQAAVLDFFFQYKMVFAYGGQFSPYQLQRSAQTLDNFLSPVLDAFYQDVDAYVTSQLDPESGHCSKARNSSSKEPVSATFGDVSVTTLSGQQATVSGDVVNYFDITQPPSLSDFLNGMSGSGAKELGTAFAGVLQPKEIALLQAIALSNSQQKVYGEVGKNFDLTITPVSLNTGSTAELDVSYEIKDDPSPSDSTQKQKDLLDRVSDSKMDTRVRVYSLRLFPITSFTMELTHPRPPKCWSYNLVCIGWQALFGSVPGLGKVFLAKQAPETKDNLSIAVIRAIVVPTAMDLGLGTPFRQDREKDGSLVRWQHLHALYEFHRNMLSCIAGANGGDSCMNSKKLTLSSKDLPKAVPDTQ